MASVLSHVRLSLAILCCDCVSSRLSSCYRSLPSNVACSLVLLSRLLSLSRLSTVVVSPLASGTPDVRWMRLVVQIASFVLRFSGSIIPGCGRALRARDYPRLVSMSGISWTSPSPTLHKWQSFQGVAALNQLMALKHTIESMFRTLQG